MNRFFDIQLICSEKWSRFVQIDLIFQFIIIWFKIIKIFIENDTNNYLIVLYWNPSILSNILPFYRIFPSCRYNIFLISTFTILYGFDIDCCFPSIYQCCLLFLIVGIEKYEFVWIEQNRILKGVPSIILKTFIITRYYFIMIRFLLIFFSIKAIFFYL